MEISGRECRYAYYFLLRCFHRLGKCIRNPTSPAPSAADYEYGLVPGLYMIVSSSPVWISRIAWNVSFSMAVLNAK